MKKKTKIILLVVAVFAAVLLVTGLFSKETIDAGGYVQANLDLIFQGESAEARKFVDASDAQFREMHDAGIDNFIQTYIMGEEGQNASGYPLYFDRVDDIFSVMKYRVDHVKEVEKNKYQVTVAFRSVDLFSRFTEKLEEGSKVIEQKAENGEYQGTDEEIQAAMLMDYMAVSYEYFEESYLEMEYSDEKEYVFTVEAGKGAQPVMNGDEINDFIEDIFELDKL